MPQRQRARGSGCLHILSMELSCLPLLVGIGGCSPQLLFLLNMCIRQLNYRTAQQMTLSKKLPYRYNRIIPINMYVIRLHLLQHSPERPHPSSSRVFSASCAPRAVAWRLWGKVQWRRDNKCDTGGMPFTRRGGRNAAKKSSSAQFFDNVVRLFYRAPLTVALCTSSQ